MSHKVLVVDDDQDLCQVIVDTLKEYGYDATFVHTAEEAEAQILADPPQLILLDLEIPQMGGFVLCQKIRAEEKTQSIPVIFLTVRDSEFDKRTAMSLGANQYVTKPFKRSLLIQEVAALLPTEASARTQVGGKVLVVDDDVELCQVVVDTLNDHGYQASFLNTAEEGLEKAIADPPNLVLLDLEVPEMGGLVYCQKLRANEITKDVPVIFVTGRVSEYDRKTAMSLGADLYLTKPFKRSQLLKEVENVLASKVADWMGPSKAAPVAETASPPVERTAPAAEAAEKGEPAPPHPSAPAKPAAALPVVPARPAGDSGRAVSAPPAAKRPALPAKPAPPSPPKKAEVKKQPMAAAGAKGGGKETYATFADFHKEDVSFWQKIKNWAFTHKRAAAGIAAAAVIGLMWGSVGLYRKFAGGKAGTQTAAGEAGVVAVNVMQALPAPFQDVLSAVGTIAGGAEIELRFQTEGKVRFLSFREGDAVHAGQVIAQLDQSQVQIKLDRARSEFYRYEKLYALGGVSKDRLEEARVQFDYAQTEMDKTVLKAPQEGILGDKGVEMGEFVTPQKKVGTLVSLNTVLVRIGVIEKEIDKIFPGQPVTITVDTYPNMEFKGKVENISPLVQGQSKTLTVEARVPNSGKLLLPGMFARTKIVIFEKDNVISVPNDALEKTQAGYTLFVVGRENKAEKRQVEVSYVSLTHSVISGGLQAGEQVIVQRPQELKEGVPLKVVEVEKSMMEAGSGEGGMDPLGAPGGQPQ